MKVQTSPKVLEIRGGATTGGKKKFGLFFLIKSFWLSLIDPENIDYIKEKSKDAAAKPKSKQKGWLSKKPKGRKLK
jgi:hypothetical protein